MPDRLVDLFPDPERLLLLEPEDLAGILLDILPSVEQGGNFLYDSFVQPCFGPRIPLYDQRFRRSISLAVAEAFSWLKHQGLIMPDPQQAASYHVLTKRGKAIRSRDNLDAYRKGHVLPTELLQPVLLEKALPQFLRGDYDVAVFQAFKELEVAVRSACGYADDCLGTTLMRRAFHTSDGPLRDASLVSGEREAEMHMFSGAIGHAKNPTSHRDVTLTRLNAARLIIFASHLLDIAVSRQAN